MKTLFAILAVLILAAPADAGLFRRRCCSSYKQKTVVHDCCGRHVSKVKVRCCPEPCCPTTAPCCPTPKPCCPGEPEPEPGKPATGDQARCEAEAAYMARYSIRGHVGGLIGLFEGCGWSSNGTPGTCTPPRGMVLTGDAIAKGPQGYYRVRSWR